MIIDASEISYICSNISDIKDVGKLRKKIIFREKVGFALIDKVVNRYDSQLRRLLANKSYMGKFSEKFLSAKLESMIVSILKKELAEEVVEKEIMKLENELNSFDTEYRVLVPLSGIQLKTPSIKCGAINLIIGGKDLLDSVVSEIGSISDTTKTPPEVRQQFVDQCNQLLSKGLSLSAIAEYRVVAEPKRAKERALDETRRALDVLRYCIPALYSKDKNVYISIAGEEVSAIRSIPVLSTDGSKFSLESDRVGMLFPFELEDGTQKHLEKLGALYLFRLLEKDHVILNSFEKALLNSIHWFASSTTQLELENQVLNLLMCLESLLSPPENNPIGTAIAEGIAWIIGNDPDSRLRIKKRVQKLYRIRSGVAHGGKKTVQPSEVDELIFICGAVLAALIHRNSEFPSQKALLEWIERKKLS